MAEIKQLFELASVPGIKRDGTVLDGNNYSDGQWVRFQRGRPKKIGGYYRVTNSMRGPIYGVLTWSKTNLNNVYSFHTRGVQMVQVDFNGVGNYIINRTPTSGFTANDNILWSFDTLFDAAAGSNKTLVLALPASLLNDPDEQTERSLFVGDAAGTGVFTDVADTKAIASGGVFTTPPYAILYGNNGKVTWSNANEPQNYTTGDAGTARVTGAKIIKGSSLRSGSGPAGLLWSLDSVVRMDWIGGSQIFKFSTLSRNSSILSANSVVEYDGSYYWIGRDRFMLCNGSQVNEIPNNMNLNWFFDGLNKSHRGKVWGMKIPRYGEIWWFYPRGEATECSHAVILNVRENSWYDIELSRTAGYHQVAFDYPILGGQEISDNRILTLTSITGSILVGDVLSGDTSGATAIIERIESTDHYCELTSEVEFDPVESITNLSRTGAASLSDYSELYSLFTHEHGVDAVGDTISAIPSWFTTSDIGFPTGGISQSTGQGLNRWTRLVRIEPDILLDGEMTLEVLSNEFANSAEVVSESFTFDKNTPKIDTRIQQRHLRLKFRSNVSGGNYELGKCLLHVEPGDIRS